MINFKMKGKIVVGLTGAISSGKSAALTSFKKAGAQTICSDTLAAKYFALLKDEIENYFKTSDRSKIAREVFKNPAKRKWLEAHLHPLIIKEAAQIIRKSKNKLIVFDVPLLFESGFENSFDLIVCIYADFKTRLKRTEFKDFKLRDGAQMPLKAKAANSDIVVYNEGLLKDLEVKIKKMCKIMKRGELRVWKTH